MTGRLGSSGFHYWFSKANYWHQKGYILRFELGKLMDGAIVLALATAALHFLGLAEHQGFASALSLPRSSLQGDVWTTVADGAQGLRYFVNFPLSFLFVSWRDWGVFAYSLVVIWLPLFLLRIEKMRPYKPILITLQALLSLYIAVLITSQARAQTLIEYADVCISTKVCRVIKRQVVLHIDIGKQEPVSKDGVVLRLTERYWIVQTGSGTLVVPAAQVKLAELIDVAKVVSPK